MGRVKIFANSASDISVEYAEQLGVTLIPDIVIFDDKAYRNNMDIDPPKLYELLRTSSKLPTTAHPNIQDYTDLFLTASDYDEILCISLTSKMSGAHNTACTTKKILEESGFAPKLTIFDSEQVSFGFAHIVIEAARLAMEGKNTEEILEHLEESKGKIGVYFVLKSLQNARKGGRVGAIRVLAADLLGVKPVLMFRDGLVRDVGIVRNYEQGLNAVFQRYQKQAKKGDEVFIFHANNVADAEKLGIRIREIDPSAKISIGWVGAAIGVYTGEGCVGIAFKES